MTIPASELIEDLLARTDKAYKAALKFKELKTDQLNYRPGPRRWSILECLEHLNRYGDFYLPEIEKQLLAHERISGDTIFKPGLVGNYFANLMEVKNGKIKKMQSPKDKNPLNSVLTSTTIDRFLKQLERLKALLAQARYSDLTRIKTGISLTKFIRLRLGDTFRFYTYHIERHVWQAEQLLS